MSRMATLTRSTTIDAPVEKVFTYALDFRNLWGQGWPDIGIADVDLKPDGVGSSVKFFAHVLGLHLEMRLEYVEVVRPERIVAKVSSVLPDRPQWTFTFTPVDEGTQLTVTGEWHVNVPAVGKAWEERMARNHEGLADLMIANIKTGVEGTTA